ncbi:MAG: tRNA (adenosine(37)-N6)-threonylcarbamoyltransferase complex transferase subunit TsaD [Clostridia bacterium]|nr:tRNA (adenosine(37)-N6)-threonylcarbamoyltransferase complex transferase subunit TsaD [Clostridia bacterium]
MNILAIESSCDETAVSIVKDGREILSGVVASQIDIHAKFGGVVPEIASRAHTECICSLTKEALAKSSLDLDAIDAIAVTYAPGLIGALLVGVNFAKGLAYSASKPLIPVHHIKGHIAANYLVHKDLKPPFYALVVSGGHTSLLKALSYTEYETIGVTRDDAAGEAFDKAARVLGLPYPGGKAMDDLAGMGNPDAIKFTVSSVNGSEYDFSFSGLKTAVINHVHNMEMRNEELDTKAKQDIAASFTKAAIKTVTSRVERLYDSHGKLPLVLAGGVAANSHLRAALTRLTEKRGTTLYMPPLSLCGDNASMIGAQAYYEYLYIKSDKYIQNTKDNDFISPLSLNAYSTMSV